MERENKEPFEEVTVECYENERYYPIHGWSPNLLPTDRYHWSSKDGNHERRREIIERKSACCSTTWKNSWNVTIDFPNDTDREGWQYAVDFQFKYYPKPSPGHFVRRKKWTRVQVVKKHSEKRLRSGASARNNNNAETKTETETKQEIIAEELKQELLQLGANAEPFDCPVCMCECDKFQGLKLNCGHQICLECLKAFLMTHIRQTTVMKCPRYSECRQLVTASDARLVLGENDWRSYLAIEVLDIRNDSKGLFNCMTPDCPNSIFIDEVMGGDKQESKCANPNKYRWSCRACSKTFCVKCKTQWHQGKSCVENKRMQQRSTDRDMEGLVKNGVVHQCMCGVYIQRNQGCQYMTCTQCGTHFCWDCKRFLRTDHQAHNCVPSLTLPTTLTEEEKKVWLRDADRRKKLEQINEVGRQAQQGFGYLMEAKRRYDNIERYMEFAAAITERGGIHSVEHGLRMANQAMKDLHWARDTVLFVRRLFGV